MKSSYNFREYRLDNGLYVALQETPTETIAAKLRINYGALHEKEGEEGLAHFLEHGFMSGGSKKYDPQQVDEIKTSFGKFEAYTTLDKTIIHGDMIEDDLNLFLDIASDLAFYPRLDSTRINEERNRILCEMSDTKSAPGWRDGQDFKQALLKDHPTNYFILGKESVIEKAKPIDLKKFHQQGYNTNNIELIIVGNLPRNVDEMIAGYFADKPTGKNKKLQFPNACPLEKKVELYRPAPELYNKDRPNESSTTITLGWLVPPETSEELFNLSILSNILGGGFSSRLFQTVSQRKGLAYSISSFYQGSYNIGLMGIGGNFPSIKQNEALDAIFEEMEKLRKRPVTQKELDSVIKKESYAIGKMFESNEGHINALERKLDANLTPEIFMTELKKITPQRLLETAQKYLPVNRIEGKYVLLVRDPLIR